MNKLIEFKEEVLIHLNDCVETCDKNATIYLYSSEPHTESLKTELFRRDGLLQSIKIINDTFDKFNKGDDLMGQITKTKFGIKVDKLWEGRWSFGICFSHDRPETYIFINFFKWTITIGMLADWSDDDEW